MSQQEMENRITGFIASKLDNHVLRKVFTLAAESKDSIDLHQEIEVLYRCIEKTNELITQESGTWDTDLAGVRNTRDLLRTHHYGCLPNVLSEDHPPAAYDLKNIIKVANTETGTTYKNPEEINNGDHLSVLRWYMWDGVARMAAIQMGISNDDKEQEKAGDLLACVFAEAAVVLAEEGDKEAQSVVVNMLDMGFIAKDWLFTDQLVERAKVFKNSNT